MIHNLESNLKQNQTLVVHLQYKWNLSFKKSYSKDVLDERQEILDRIVGANNKIDDCKYKLEKYRKMYKFFYNCYYYVDKAMY